MQISGATEVLQQQEQTKESHLMVLGTLFLILFLILRIFIIINIVIVVAFVVHIGTAITDF
jgi:hypothetical protein